MLGVEIVHNSIFFPISLAPRLDPTNEILSISSFFFFSTFNRGQNPTVLRSRPPAATRSSCCSRSLLLLIVVRQRCYCEGAAGSLFRTRIYLLLLQLKHHRYSSLAATAMQSTMIVLRSCERGKMTCVQKSSLWSLKVQLRSRKYLGLWSEFWRKTTTYV